jgi:hypothetical protein
LNQFGALEADSFEFEAHENAKTKLEVKAK